MKSLKDLNINKVSLRANLENEIKTFFGENSSITINEKGKDVQIIISQEGNNYKFNIYSKKDGTTSLLSQGSPATQEKTDLFLDSLQKKYVITEKKNFAFSVPNITNDNLNVLYGYFENDLHATIVEDKVDSNGVLRKYKAETDDILTIKRYHNGNTFFQGKPLFLYAKLCEFLSGFCSAEDIIQAQKENYKIDINKTYVECQYESKLMQSHTFLDDNIKDILLPAFSLTNVEIELTDYSLFVFPVLRGLEAYIKKIFLDYGITIDNRNNPIGNFFTKSLNDFVLKTDYRGIIHNTKTIDALGKLYTEYYFQRNSLFHVDIIAPKLIEKREEADLIFNTVIDLIESTYIDIHS